MKGTSHCWLLNRRMLVAMMFLLAAQLGCRDRPITDHQCGDGRVDPDELCDDGVENSDVTPGACRTDCNPAHCGDGVADPNESCDGTDLAGASCLTLGYNGGNLSCLADCSNELSDCESTGRCGDDILDTMEECDDGNELDGDGCEACRVMPFSLDDVDDCGVPVGVSSVSISTTGRALVALGVSCWPGITTVAYLSIHSNGNLSGELLFDLGPGIPLPTETGFYYPGVAMVGGRAVFVFQECMEDFTCPNALDGSGLGIFQATSSGIPQALQVNSFTAGDQSRPRLSALSSGESVVVWQSDGQDGSGWGVFAQLYTGDGTPLGLEISVNETTAGDQQLPDVAMLDDGGFVVVWESQNASSISDGIFLRRYDQQGVPLDVETQVAEAVPIDEGLRKPRVEAWTGGFAVVWQAWAEDGDGWGAYGRSFDTDGTAITSDLVLSEAWQDDQVRPAVAIDETGSFVAVWQDRSSGEWLLRGRRFEFDGSPTSTEFAVERQGWDGEPTDHDIAMAPDGRFVVAWHGSVAQRFLPDGTAIGLAPW